MAITLRMFMAVFFFVLTTFVVRADSIHLVLAYPATQYQRQVVGAFAEKLEQNLDSDVEIVAMPQWEGADIALERYSKLQARDTGDFYVLGHSLWFSAQIYERNDAFIPEWISGQQDTTHPDKGFSDDGMVYLGAGWRAGEGAAPILSIPARSGISLPVVTMTVITGGSRDQSSSDDIPNLVSRALFETKEGRDLVHAFTLIPNLPTSLEAQAHPETSGALTIRMRPEWNADGEKCGCDNNDEGSIMSCDPDGYVIESMSRLQRDGDRVLLTQLASDDDGCDPCEEGSMVSVEGFVNSLEHEKYRIRASEFGGLSEFNQHVEDLIVAHHGEGRPSYVMTCDPD